MIISCLFHPTIRPRWNKVYREKLLNNFLETVLTQKSIDAQQYWQFRERYSPGYFKFNQENIDFLQTFKIINISDTGVSTLLYYDSPFLISMDAISKDLAILEKIKNDNQAEILLSNDTLLLTKSTDEQNPQIQEYNLWFLLAVETMQITNGLFDYTGDELSLLENAYWLNHTQINVF